MSTSAPALSSVILSEVESECCDSSNALTRYLPVLISNVLVLADCYNSEGLPVSSNYR